MKSLYKARILDPKKEEEERQRNRAALLNGAWKAIERGMNLPHLAAAKPRLAKEQNLPTQPMVLAINANPSSGFADSCCFLIWATMRTKDSETISVSAMGFFGPLDDALGQRPHAARRALRVTSAKVAFLQSPEVQALVAEAQLLWQAPMHADDLEQCVRDWVAGMIGSYFRLSRARCELMIGAGADPEIRRQVAQSRPTAIHRFSIDGAIYPLKELVT